MLADFGLSRALEYSDPDMKTSSYDRFKGTNHWIAYELAKILEHPNQEIDVDPAARRDVHRCRLA